MTATSSIKRLSLLGIFVLALTLTGWVAPAHAQVTAFMQSVAEAAAKDRDIAEFYKSNGYKAIWTAKGNRAKARRAALLKAVQNAGAHGLPVERYSIDTLSINPRRVKSERELGRLEVEMSRLFLRYARDVQTGVLVPRKIDRGIVREVPYRSRTSLLKTFAKSSPKTYIKRLPPSSPEYTRLMKEKMRFEKIVGKGGWGAKVQAKSLKPGQSGGAVVQMRNRLINMGYLRRTSSKSYDNRLQQAVAAFQRDHGLYADGVAGQGTLAEINVEPTTRLSQIIVAMERERWINMPLGKRHIWVNITDYHAKIIDNGKVTFETRSVVGARRPGSAHARVFGCDGTYGHQPDLERATFDRGEGISADDAEESERRRSPASDRPSGPDHLARDGGRLHAVRRNNLSVRSETTAQPSQPRLAW